jgi:hypothetical protein
MRHPDHRVWYAPRETLDGRLGAPVRRGNYLPVHAFAACLAIAGCAAAPATPTTTEAVIREPSFTPPSVAPSPQTVAQEQRRVVVKSAHAVAEAKRYVAWKQAKTPIVSHLTELTNQARKSILDLQAAKTLDAKTVALSRAEDAVGALQHYLCCEKPDNAR